MRTRFLNFKDDSFSAAVRKVGQTTKRPKKSKIAWRFLYSVFWVAGALIALQYAVASGNHLASIAAVLLSGAATAHLGFTGHMSGHIAGSAVHSLEVWHNRMYDIFLGVSSHIWRIRHNFYHHIYTNVAQDGDTLDPDTMPAAGTTRYNETETEKNAARAVFSFIFGSCFLLPGFYFFDLITYVKKGVKHIEITRPTGFEHLWFFIGKLLYALVYVILPLLFVGPEGVAWSLLSLMVGSIILFPSFEIAHSNEDSQYVFITGKTSTMSWEELQIRTSANFSMNNSVATWFFNGLNYQIEHHLFPAADYAGYPAASREVRGASALAGLKYLAFPTWIDGVRSVVRNYACGSTAKNTTPGEAP